MFAGAKMRGANLSIGQHSFNGSCDQFEEWGSIGSCFAGADMVGANLRHRCFRNSNFALADLRNADLTGAAFSGSNFKPKWRYKFEKTKLCKTILDDTEFWDVNLEDTDFSEVISAKGASFGRVDFGTAILDNANFGASRITKSNFFGWSKFSFKDVIFAETAFIKCDFSEADLTLGNFEGAKFEDCIFSNTRMPDGTIKNS
jgi:uncharacterized protein YjbI with pentapeptide repeats